MKNKRFEFRTTDNGITQAIERKLSSELHEYVVKVIAESSDAGKVAKIYEILLAIENAHPGFPLNWLDADRIANEIGIKITI